MNDRIALSINDHGVADVQLDRADKMNALDARMFEALLEVGDTLAATRGLRAVVLSGRGRAFCAGLDMGRFQAMNSGEGDGSPVGRDLAKRTHGDANAAQQVAMQWQQLPVPVIAAVHGVAFGGGLQVALGADIRLVTADVKMSVMEIKWGLVPDMAGMVLLRSLVRGDVLRELTFSGRQINGTEAVALGLATRVVADPLAEALALAHEIAGKNPDAIRAGKRLLNLTLEGSSAQVLQAESDEQKALMGSPNQTEAVRAQMEKRSPKFVD